MVCTVACRNTQRQRAGIAVLAVRARRVVAGGVRLSNRRGAAPNEDTTAVADGRCAQLTLSGQGFLNGEQTRGQASTQGQKQSGCMCVCVCGGGGLTSVGGVWSIDADHSSFLGSRPATPRGTLRQGREGSGQRVFAVEVQGGAHWRESSSRSDWAACPTLAASRCWYVSGDSSDGSGDGGGSGSGGGGKSARPESRAHGVGGWYQAATISYRDQRRERRTATAAGAGPSAAGSARPAARTGHR